MGRKLTTPQVAEILGVSIRRVQALIKDGRLKSEQIGREHIIDENNLQPVRERKTGRPSKKSRGQNSKVVAKKKGGKK